MERWNCHICKKSRPDDVIAVLTKPLIINGISIGKQNIRYCIDNPDCRLKAKDFSFFNENKEQP